MTERPTVGTAPQGDGSHTGSDTARVEQAALATGTERRSGLAAVLRSSAGRNLGLVVALGLLCLAGVITAGDRFATVDNMLFATEYVGSTKCVSPNSATT